MNNINFDNPYLLLLLIPLVLIVSIPFFIAVKKDNFNIHNIFSYVCHIVMCVLLTLVIIFLIFVAISIYANSVLSAAIILIGCLISIIIGIIAFLMEQIGLCHMIYNGGSLSKAFAISEIKEAIEEIGWFNCIITYVGLIIITAVIASVTSMIIGLIFTSTVIRLK